MSIVRLVIVGALLSSTAALFCQTQAQAPDLRTQLAAIDYRHFSDLDDYISRCQKVKVLLPSLDSFYNQSDATLAQLRIKYRDNPHLLKMADFYTSMNKLDKAGLVLLRQEMELASEMSRLSQREQQSFFDKEIIPIQAQEDRLSKQEIQTAIDAKRSGIPLPPDIDRSLSDMK